jgi:hypothetical protein
MKYLKMLGLAAVAASALMAFVGAGSASATALCSALPTGSPLACPAGTVLAKGAKILGKSTKSGVLTTSSGTITCTSSHFEDELTSAAASGADLSDKVLSLTFTGCTTTIGGCSVESVTVVNGGNGLASKIKYVKTTLPEGEFEIVNPKTTVKLVKCFFGLSATCVYAEADTIKGTLHNEGKPENLIIANAVVHSKSGGLCPAEGTESVGYHVTVVGSGNLAYVADH